MEKMLEERMQKIGCAALLGIVPLRNSALSLLFALHSFGWPRLLPCWFARVSIGEKYR